MGMEMNKLDARQQLMVITAEECGELIQVLSKILRRGEIDDEYREKLVEEVGDVYAMIDIMHEYDLVSWEELEDRAEYKKEKLKKWSDLYG
jgi:NTP pyrophosphatase (non-canonical NTP hydrolase)